MDLMAYVVAVDPIKGNMNAEQELPSGLSTLQQRHINVDARRCIEFIRVIETLLNKKPGNRNRSDEN